MKHATASMNFSGQLSELNYFEALFTLPRQNSVIALDATGHILKINSAFSVHFGYESKAIVGQHFSILFTEESREANMPERELNNVLKHGQAYDNNYLVRKDKQVVWVAGESVLLHDEQGEPCILKIFYSLQLLKETETSVVRLHELNENILASIEDIVLVVDEKLIIEKANPAFYILFDQPEQNAGSINFARIIEFDGKNEVLKDSLTAALQMKKGFHKKIMSVLTPGGKNKILEVSCTHLRSSWTNHLLLIMHDITIQIEIQREREDIIGFVAHELRNPLSNIVLCNEMIERLANDKNQEEIAAFATRSKNNTLRLSKMVTGLYDATKVNSGSFTVELFPMSLSALLQEARQSFQILQPAYHIHITDSTQNLVIAGDRNRLMQVIENFVGNSIKYSNGNSNIYITLEADEDTVTFSIKDEGLGIAANQLPHIFDRFFRAEKTKNLEGIGLGLYLCRQVILAHKGRVWVESEEGKGSAFFFSIPIKQY